MSDHIQVIQADPSEITYQQDKAAIDIQVSTAKTYPRNLMRSIENAVAIATLDKATAQTCTYSLPRSGKSISGPSVHLAKILAQTWGNLRVDAKVIEIGKTQITSQAVAFDLENNLAIKVEVKRSIMTRSGRMNDDMITVTGNAANAIALRNAVFAVIPRNVVDKVYNAALKTITGDLSTEEKLIAKRKQMFDYFIGTYGLTEQEVLSAVGKAASNFITADDIVTLLGVDQAIKDGDISVDNAFKKNSKKATVDVKTNPKSEMQKFIEEEVDTLEALEAAKEQLKTEAEKAAYEKRLKELSK